MSRRRLRAFIVAASAWAIVAGVVVFVVPDFRELFIDFQAESPTGAALLIEFSRRWYFLLPVF